MLAQYHTPAQIAEAVTDIRRRVVRPRLPEAEQYRTYYGRSLDLGRIEAAIRDAEVGLMTRLCDLESETLSLDPHCSGLAAKRFGQVQAVDWLLEPATGPGIDKTIAREIADETRAQLERIPEFTQRIYDLGWAEFDGRAALENLWQYVGGKWPWRVVELGWIHPRRLAFGPERELLLIHTLHERTGFSEQGIRFADHPGKFVCWLPRLFREYPEREGLGPRSLYWTFFKRFSWRLRMTLTELYALPWRIVSAEKDSGVAPEQLDEAATAVENLGRDTTANLGRPGVKVDVVFPGENSGQLFQITNEDVDKQLSKLYLGQTGTTETDQGNRAGMVIARGEQDIILYRTGVGISEQITAQLCLPICVLNRGADLANHAARFRLETSPPRDRDKELAIRERAVKLQVPVALAELREVTGIREPQEEEAYVVAAGATTDALGNPLPDAVRIVDPASVDEATDALPAPERAGVPGAADAVDIEQSTAAERTSLTVGGVLELCHAAGVALTKAAAETLVAIPEPMRAGILERLLAGDHRPLDP